MRKSSRAILAERRAALRQLNPQHSPVSWRGWLVVGVVAFVVLMVLHHALGSWLAVAGMFLVVVLFFRSVFEEDQQKLRLLAAGRPGESICTFSRSFPKATRNPLLIRAVYETLQQDYLSGSVPLRPSDRLEEDLAMDEEDIDDVAGELARLTHRSWTHLEANPLFGKVRTAGDLVAFLRHQPALAHG